MIHVQVLMMDNDMLVRANLDELFLLRRMPWQGCEEFGVSEFGFQAPTRHIAELAGAV